MPVRRRTISEFHYEKMFVNPGAFASSETLLDDLAFKLGLPGSAPRTFDVLTKCLDALDRDDGPCSHWDFLPGKHLVFRVTVGAEPVDESVMRVFTAAIAAANDSLGRRGSATRVWVEFVGDDHGDHL